MTTSPIITAAHVGADALVRPVEQSSIPTQLPKIAARYNEQLMVPRKVREPEWQRRKKIDAWKKSG
ncbi:MAG TPA: hypothetical protein VGG46_12210 [Terriglobales bacterium]|jgi:hypothetical protein